MENEIEPTNTEDQDEASVDKVANPAPKTFTQVELDRIVQKRVAAEKKTHDAIYSEAATKADKLETYLGEILDTQLSGLPENIRKLLDKLSVEDKIEWLKDPANQVSIPETPKSPKAAVKVPQFRSDERKKF